MKINFPSNTPIYYEEWLHVATLQGNHQPFIMNHYIRKAAYAAFLNFKHRASSILGQAFRYYPDNAFYIFNQQIYFIILYLFNLHR